MATPRCRAICGGGIRAPVPTTLGGAALRAALVGGGFAPFSCRGVRKCTSAAEYYGGMVEHHGRRTDEWRSHVILPRKIPPTACAGDLTVFSEAVLRSGHSSRRRGNPEEADVPPPHANTTAGLSTPLGAVCTHRCALSQDGQQCHAAHTRVGRIWYRRCRSIWVERGLSVMDQGERGKVATCRKGTEG